MPIVIYFGGAWELTSHTMGRTTQRDSLLGKQCIKVWMKGMQFERGKGEKRAVHFSVRLKKVYS